MGGWCSQAWAVVGEPLRSCTLWPPSSAWGTVGTPTPGPSRRGVARRHRARPLVEPSWGSGESFSVKYQGGQLAEDSLCQHRSAYCRGDHAPCLSWSPLSPPMKWRWGRCGVTQPLWEEVNPVCASLAEVQHSLRLNGALRVDRSEVGTS